MKYFKTTNVGYALQDTITILLKSFCFFLLVSKLDYFCLSIYNPIVSRAVYSVWISDGFFPTLTALSLDFPLIMDWLFALSSLLYSHFIYRNYFFKEHSIYIIFSPFVIMCFKSLTVTSILILKLNMSFKGEYNH